MKKNNFLISLLKIYQIFISPILGKNCRFYPSCSDYAILVLRKYKKRKAFFLILKRILKCHPLSKGGIDLP